MAKSRKTVSTEEAIGQVCMAWSVMEHMLGVILSELLETDLSTALITSAALDYRHRRDLINSLAEFKFGSTPVFDDVKKYIAQVNGMSKERNEAVHAMWHRKDGDRHDQRILLRNRGLFEFDMKPLSSRHLLTVARKIAQLAQQGGPLRSRVQAAVKEWRQNQPPPGKEGPPIVSGHQLIARIGIERW
jgi:hypothetical protein